MDADVDVDVDVDVDMNVKVVVGVDSNIEINIDLDADEIKCQYNLSQTITLLTGHKDSSLSLCHILPDWRNGWKPNKVH